MVGFNDDDGDGGGNGWSEWRRHIILELQRLNSNLEKLEAKSSDHILKASNEISRLKVWAVVYGATAGTVASVVLREVISRW